MNFRNLVTVPALSLLSAAALFSAQPAFALPSNEAPPTGAILDLNGQAIPTTSFQTYTSDFTAGVANTDITFAIRNDPSFTSLTNVSVTDMTTPSSNLIVNGTFLGTGDAITGWTYDNVYGATYGGYANNGLWYDGAVQAYDAIDQLIATTVGDVYQISFSLQGAGDATFSDLSTNGNVTNQGGNGNDVLVYAQNGLPPAGAVPEPGTLLLIGAGLAGLFMLRRQKNA